MSLATADLCDRHEDQLRAGRLRVMAPLFRSFGGRSNFSGPIATLKLYEDNSFVRRSLETPGAGRVLVIDGGGSLRRALVGDQLAALGVRNNWRGLLIHGCIRDSAAIRTMDLGVLALATHPQKTDKKNVGEAEVALSFGGVTLKPGEWLYADEDGVLVADAPLA